jgi:hypothetical protein
MLAFPSWFWFDSLITMASGLVDLVPTYALKQYNLTWIPFQWAK